MQQVLTDESALLSLAGDFAKAITTGFRLYLAGELGVGKTTFTRGFLRQRSIQDAVKSPTYTLVETYTLADRLLHHFDLYRLQSAHELDYIGLEDYFDEEAIVIVEWPEKGLDILPSADILCTLSYHEQGRLIHCVAHSARGHKVLALLGKK